MSVTEISSGEELITDQEAIDWCRANSSDAAFLSSLVSIATQSIESHTGRALKNKTLVYRADCFPACPTITLEQPPLRKVNSVKYIDTSGAEQTLSDTKYTVDIYSEPGRIVLNEYETWPQTKEIANAVIISFDAGYMTPEEEEAEEDESGADDDSVSYLLPPALKAAILFLVAHYYSHREPIMPGVSVAEIPHTLVHLFFPWKVNW